MIYKYGTRRCKNLLNNNKYATYTTALFLSVCVRRIFILDPDRSLHFVFHSQSIFPPCIDMGAATTHPTKNT
jgi:hypothetical protein